MVSGLGKVRTLLGPPGTGKTTELMSQIERLLAAGVRPDEIAFVSFTRAATHEAIDRASRRFDVDPDGFPWFKTIHAMARRATAERVEVMEAKDWKDFGESCSYSFSDDEGAPEGCFSFAEDGDCLRSVDQLARLMRTTIGAAVTHAGDVPAHLTPSMFVLYSARLTEWKLAHKKIDFVDMLERALRTQWRPPVRFAFVDEAQDNSSLQNGLIRHWFVESSRCEELTWAGDDDQQIFGWSGAQRGTLLWLARNTSLRILTQSHRVPRAAHALAQSIIRQNRERVEKVYAPRDERGVVAMAASPAEALSDLAPGGSLYLVRNVMFAKPVRASLLAAGRLFRCEVGSGSPLDHKDSRGAFGAVSSWRREGNASADEFRGLLACIPSKHGDVDILPRGIKARAKENADPVPLWRAREEFGLAGTVQAFLGVSPFSLLYALPSDERAYLDMVLATDPQLKGDVLTVTTKHRSKGREAENVIISPNMARRSARRYAASPAGFEEENCVAYVAATRTRQRLVLIDPDWRDYYDYARHARVA